jgi:hypothetical protein
VGVGVEFGVPIQSLIFRRKRLGVRDAEPQAANEEDSYVS